MDRSKKPLLLVVVVVAVVATIGLGLYFCPWPSKEIAKRRDRVEAKLGALGSLAQAVASASPVKEDGVALPSNAPRPSERNSLRVHLEDLADPLTEGDPPLRITRPMLLWYAASLVRRGTFTQAGEELWAPTDAVAYWLDRFLDVRYVLVIRTRFYGAPEAVSGIEYTGGSVGAEAFLLDVEGPSGLLGGFAFDASLEFRTVTGSLEYALAENLRQALKAKLDVFLPGTYDPGDQDF